MAALDDPTLRGLLLDRDRLLRELAPVLRRVGPSRTRGVRRRLNGERRVKRLELRRAVRLNAEAIAARCADLSGIPERRVTDTREENK
jgi:hypothetical protein